MADINLDGLADIVYESDSNYIHVLPGTGMWHDGGNGWFGEDKAWRKRPYEREDECPGFRMGDVNGDSAPDIIYDTVHVEGGQDDHFYVMLMEQPPDLLETIQNGIGGTYTIEYAPSSAYDNSAETGGYLPYVVQTVSAIKADDGNGSLSVTRFDYGGGYHDSLSREFRGFEWVKRTEDPVGSVVETVYHRGTGLSGAPDSLKGLVRKVTTSSASSQGIIYYKLVTNTYDVTSSFDGTKFPRLRQVDKKVYGEDRTRRTLRTKIDGYDGYGNVTKKTLYGDVSDTLDGRIERTASMISTAMGLSPTSRRSTRLAEEAWRRS